MLPRVQAVLFASKLEYPAGTIGLTQNTPLNPGMENPGNG